MSHPNLFIVGIMLFSYLAPEILAAAFNAKVPGMFNLMSAVAGGLVAAALVL